MKNFLGPVLRELRTATNLSGRDVSRLLGKSEAYVNNLEHGRDLASPESLLRLARLYKATPRRLLKLLRKDILARTAARLESEHDEALKTFETGENTQENFAF